MAINTDGWLNLLTGLGSKFKDKSRNNIFTSEHSLPQNILESIYRSDGFGKRIIDLIPSEMLRQWINIPSDPENKILGILDTINAKARIVDLIRWSRLYGGAILVIGARDNGELSDPLNIRNIESIDFLHVFDRHQVNFTDDWRYKDPMNPKYGELEYYEIFPVRATNPFIVHESRIIRIDGEQLPDRLRQLNNDWGDSVLQSSIRELRNLGGLYNATTNIVEDFIQTILTIDNLGNLLASGQDEIIRKRLDIIDMSRSVANTIILDKEENYQKQSSSVAGLDSLIDKFVLSLSATTGIPVTILMGQSPAGLNATGTSDVRMFYDMIKSEQEDKLRPIFERLIKLIYLSKSGPTKGIEPDNWTFEFNPLWQNSKEEEALYRKVIAETDAIYIQNGVVDPSEIAISRFGGGSFSSETNIDLELREIQNAYPTQTTIDEYKNIVKKQEVNKDHVDSKLIEIAEKLLNG